MINTSEEKSRAKSAKDAENRSSRRALQAQIVAGLQTLLEADEQLLGFTRGLIAGGLRGKLTVGFEALFAPYVNIGLTERRVVLQHVQPDSGRPNEILPHSFPLSELHSVAFSDIETFGNEPSGRLNLRLFNEQHFRLRFSGAENVANAKSIAEVFLSLTSTRPKARTSPTQSLCPHCDQILDRVSKFCPYCGTLIAPNEPEMSAPDAMDTTSSAGSPAQTTEVSPADQQSDSEFATAQTDGQPGDQPAIQEAAAVPAESLPADLSTEASPVTETDEGDAPTDQSTSEPAPATAKRRNPRANDQPAAAAVEGEPIE
jgi:hypothetical protein